MEWISVKDRLPEFPSTTELVSESLLYVLEGQRKTMPGYYHVNGCFYPYRTHKDEMGITEKALRKYSGLRCKRVTHWMPLPDPPKECE
jgi:hypothetical protein